MNDFLDIHSKLFSAVKQDDYAGWDPFDGLNSRIFRALSLDKFPFVRLAWIQLFKRSPINLRDLACVPKARNPKGIAIFILALLEEYGTTKNPLCREEAVALGEWLLSQRCDRALWGEAAWGYHFDWQARAFFVPAGTPNIITTVYVCLSLKALTESTQREDFGQALRHACEFIATRMYAEGEVGAYYQYIPGEDTVVHNANLWGAAMAGLAAKMCENSAHSERARRAIATSLEAQSPDGAWPYGKRDHHGFVDSFHTGFNLEALHCYRQYTGDQSVSDAIASGLRYYRGNFFLADGTPKYYASGVYPIDMHCTSQAVLTLLRVGGNLEDRKIARRVLQWSCDNMRDPKSGLFFYQRKRHYTNRISYVRWTQAWMLYALAVALREAL